MITDHIRIIIRKGILESLVYGFQLIQNILYSKITIFWLRLRGYNLDFSVTLRGKNTFFQSRKGAINIDKNVAIGPNVKICAGFNGIIRIDEGVGVYDNTHIDIQDKLEIGKHTLIAPFCYIADYDHNTSMKNKPIIEQGYLRKPIIIGNNVWIGVRSVILKGVKIGDNSIIGAGSVVTRDIPPNSIAVGNPARVIRKI